MTDKPTPPIPLVAGELEEAMARVEQMADDLTGDPAGLAWPYALTNPTSMTCQCVVRDLRTLLAHIKAGEPK